ncbi:MAG: DUF4845 domain-containing protein [Methylomicrobium sp.]|jgi:hypothetical protein|nr:DUF4845 domain-containing protein [Methylomicrobium sp.]
MSLSSNRESGLTLITLTLLLGFIGFITLLVLKIAPIYIDHSKVKSALTGVEQMENIETVTKEEVWSSLEKRFNMNYVTDVTKDNVIVTRRGSYLKVEIEYEVVKPIVGNLSVLVNFYEIIEVGQE